MLVECNKCNNSNFFGGYGQGATDANFSNFLVKMLVIKQQMLSIKFLW
jgi:hypothetical protein